MDLMAILEALHKQNMEMKDKGYGNLKGFEDAVKGSSDTTKNMANGGMAEDQLPESSLASVLTNINQIPPTDYSMYKDITAEDRANLAQQLMKQQHSGGNLVASGLAGLGDAISNSYGGKNTTFQKDVMAGAEQNTKDRLGALDTQRTQKMQDVENDPNHPMAKSMRDTLKAAGLNVPSGMPVSVMLKIAGPLGDFALKQATQAIQQQQANEAARHNKVVEGLTGSNQEEDLKEKYLKRRADAAEGLQRRPWYQKAAELVLPDSDATKEMRSQLGSDEEVNHGIPDLGSTFNGGKVKKVTRID